MTSYLGPMGNYGPTSSSSLGPVPPSLSYPMSAPAQFYGPNYAQQHQQMMAYAAAGLYGQGPIFTGTARPYGPSTVGYSNRLLGPVSFGNDILNTPDSGINHSQQCAMDLSSSSGNNTSSSSGSGSGSGQASDESFQTSGREDSKAIIVGGSASSGQSNASALALTPYYRPSTMNLPSNFDPYFKYCDVPGRLALLSNTQKYPVTLSEIYRRISPPECLNASYLGGILRKAKNKNGGKTLREHLRSYSMHLPSGRRKSATITTFTSLCEAEAFQMASDFNRLNEKDFPKEECAKDLVKQTKSPDEMRGRLAAVMSASQLVGEAISMVRNVEQGTDQNSLIPVDPSTRDGIIRFSRLTHGFGNHAVLRAWETFQEILQQCFVKLGADMAGGADGGSMGFPGVFTTPTGPSSSSMHNSATSGSSVGQLGSGGESGGSSADQKFSSYLRAQQVQQLDLKPQFGSQHTNLRFKKE